MASSLLFPPDVHPLVSFVIPVRNDAARLQRCLTSIVSNDYPRALIEIIVVDNGSTDESARIARAAGAVVLRSDASSVAELRNRGARAALGSIIAFADSDHEIDRAWIETAVDVLSDRQVAAAGAPCVPQPSPNWVQSQYDRLRDHCRTRQDVTWLGSGNMAVKRTAFEQVGGFNANLTACEDVDLCNRLRAHGWRLVADPGLRSIHFGDPQTLKALFLGELWRGRDNLAVTLRGPKTLRDLRSAVIPLVQLPALALALAALVMQWWPLFAVATVLAFAPAALRAWVMARRQAPATWSTAAQALAVAVVFDAARALAIVARGSHRARRSA